VTDPFVLTLSCPNRAGIVQAVSSHLGAYGCDIVEHQQFDDPVSGRLFMRTRASTDTELDTLAAGFADVAAAFGMEYAFHPRRDVRVLVMVSKSGHCLNDLIFRWRTGSLDGELVGVVSNHEDLRAMAESAGLPFFHVPVSPATKADAEAQLLTLVDDLDVELVVLARYMQILSDRTCVALRGRAINIHHSFLPGFVGAKPYHQAYDRGVKLVGATAHYVTPDLDEGPIIEQDVVRVDHRHGVDDLVRLGADVERAVLSRAVLWHCEDRIIRYGNQTIVF
jgi:formyltetrahydrofolate deformylase